jgi:hypothetical protein
MGGPRPHLIVQCVETYVWLVFCEIGHTSGTSDIALGNTRKFWDKKVISMSQFLSSMLRCQKEVCRCGHFGCGKMVQIWKFQEYAECPLCPEQDEDPPHILNCPAPSATLRWEKALTVLEVWMTAHHTMPELTTALLRCLHKWKHPNPSRRFARAAITTRYSLWAAILEQDDIGWYNFIMGRPSVRWRNVQH